MAIPTDLLPTTCDVYRPFGAAGPTATGVRCRLVADYARGRPASSGGPAWTHYLDLDPAADVLGGAPRPPGSLVLTFADGDEVRVPTGAAAPRYVVVWVVWVERVHEGTPREFKRAYLLRDTA